MPQSTFRQSHPVGTHLPLAKFSYTTTPAAHLGPLAWCHINGCGDLACVFEQFSSGDRAYILIMKVIQNDSTILEQIDVARFVRSQPQSGSTQPGSLPKPPFAVVVKSPCLAVKYPLNGSTRRFQVKFLMERDYYTALSVLSEINCPLTEGNTSSMQPPRRAPSSSSWASSSQAPTVLLNEGITAMTPESNAAFPFYPMTRHWSGGMTTPQSAYPATGTITNATSDICRTPARPQCVSRIPEVQPPPTLPNPVVPEKGITTETPELRPAATPAYHDIQELDQALPPKRSLPFPKPGAKRQRTASANGKSARQRTTSEPSRNVRRGNQTSRGVLERQDSIVSNATSHSLTQTQPYPESNQIPNMSQEPESTQIWSQRENNENQRPPQHLDATMAAVSGSETVNDVQVPRSPSPEQRSAPSCEDQLAAYLSAPSNERIAFLENWMCELIEDDKFMALCEDVDSTWRRFAFGIKR
ncbi:hypothetical protein N7532_008661 [Penicillium argentinense]|uniref:Uncharacterized protein n=1 Tax=Penicillium argentinense TaxID=1131581 RepID=A0A9W9EXU8_9EURO|nr:uncharacterized protein N7532_008661 [Penicillium argentinense]KAJ5089977.1 hypothetical protein N7532_008661 [Penicillium argentinense]